MFMVYIHIRTKLGLKTECLTINPPRLETTWGLSVNKD